MIKEIIQKRNKFIPLERINFEIEHYKPKRNKMKVGLLFGLVILCLVTPCTNWIIPLTMKGISKFKPLWLYN